MSNPDETDPPLVEATINPTSPRQQQLAVELWNILTRDAKWDKEHGWVWEGRISVVHEELDISQPYYQAVYAHLQRMGCVSLLRRGGGGRESLLALHFEPTDVTWREGNRHVTNRSVTAAQAQQIRDLIERVARLEDMAHIHPVEQIEGND